VSPQVLTADAMEKSMSAEENRRQNGVGAVGVLNHVEKPENMFNLTFTPGFACFACFL
jgi:hypothetical protein